MSAVLLSSKEDFSNLEKIKDNFEWFYENYEDLKRNFSNRYVAIRDRRQIDDDHNLDKLLIRLRLENFEDAIAIEFVNP